MGPTVTHGRPLLVALLMLGVALAGCTGSSTAPGLDQTGGTPTPPAGEERAPRYVLEGVVVTPEQVGVGDTVTVTTTIVNVGTDAGTAVVVPVWDGEPVRGTQEIDLLVNKRKNLTFEVTAAGPAGTHLVGLLVAGGTPVQEAVEVVAPDPKVTSWTHSNPYCDQYTEIDVTVTNDGGGLMSGWTLDVYSYNEEDKPMGHASFEVPELGAKEPAVLEGEIFTPVKCGISTTYTLEFILSNGEEERRERSAPFNPVTT